MKSGEDVSYRFLDFAPPSPDSYQSSYSDYVASVFVNEPFSNGGTYTADALERFGVTFHRPEKLDTVKIHQWGFEIDQFRLIKLLIRMPGVNPGATMSRS